MPSRVLIVALVLMAAGGIIAYIGDTVGKRLGKRRVSVFGLRPRSTAILISTLAGVVIALLSLGVLLGLASPVREALLHYDDLQASIADAEQDLAATQGRLTEAEKSARLADAQQRKSEEARRHAEEAARGAEADLSTTQESLRGSQESLRGSQQSLQQVEFRLTTTKSQLEKETEALYGVSGAYSAEVLAARPVVFAKFDELARVILDPGMALDEVRDALVELKARADKRAEEKGAKPLDKKVDPEMRVTIFRHEEDRNAEEHRPALTPNPEARKAIYDQASRDFHRELEAGNRVIAQILAAFGSVEDRPVLVELAGGAIVQVLSKGEVLGQAAIDGSLSYDDVVGELQRLAETVSATLLGRGMIPPPGGSFGSLRPSEINSLVTEIQRRGGKVNVIVRSAEDTDNIGTLVPEFVIPE